MPEHGYIQIKRNEDGTWPSGSPSSMEFTMNEEQLRPFFYVINKEQERKLRRAISRFLKDMTAESLEDLRKETGDV